MRKNLIYNYASQLYSAGIALLILPLYIKYMGPEAYGLVGFFTMLQAWFALLDLGLTPTISRETARYHGGSMTALRYRQLFRSLSIIFFVIAVVGGGLGLLMADTVAHKWLTVEAISMNAVVLSVQIMAVSVALRWLGGLYRGVISGSERLVWLSTFNALIATLRTPAVFISMWIYGFTPSVFFWHQLAVAIAEVTGLYIKTASLKPMIPVDVKIGWSVEPVKPVLKFALMIAFTSSVWVMVTQLDKLILSGVLPLAEYGLFSLAILAASGIMLLSAPISTVLMPRMARLHAEGNREELIKIYRNSTQIVSVVAGSVAVAMAICAEPLLYAWTGDRDIAAKAAPILTLYVLGNGVLAISAFPYYLQYALGNLRYHLLGNIIIIVTLVPAITLAATFFGAVGAGWAWLGVNLLYFCLWVGYVHEKFIPGLHRRWVIKDVSVIIISWAPWLIYVFNDQVDLDGRIDFILFFSMLLFGMLILSCCSSSLLREYIMAKSKILFSKVVGTL